MKAGTQGIQSVNSTSKWCIRRWLSCVFMSIPKCTGQLVKPHIPWEWPWLVIIPFIH